MELRNLALLRMDYVLGEETDELIENLKDLLGGPPTRTAIKDIRDNQNRSMAFISDPEVLGFTDDFDTLSVHLNETNDAITELLTLVTIDLDQLDIDVIDGEDNAVFAKCPEWEHNLRNIRTAFQRQEQGPETTIYWANFKSLPDELTEESIDLERAHEALSNEEPRNILKTFNFSTSGGIVALEEETLLLTKDPSKWRGKLFAIDLCENLTSTAAAEGHTLHGPWPVLSKLYGIHYWARVRGLILDQFEENMDDANTNLPSADTDDDLGTHIDLDATIFRLQEEWISLNNQLSLELRQMRRGLESHSADIRGVSRRQITSETDSGRPGPLQNYRDQLSTEIDRLRFDANRLDRRLNSLSRVFHNRISMIGTRENIELQEDVREQTKQSLDLQSRVSLFTLVVVGLTVVLVFDAAMSGGLSGFIDAAFNGHLDLTSMQSLTGISIVVILIAAGMYYKSNF